MTARRPTFEDTTRGLDPARRASVTRLRALVRSTLPEAEETIKYGQPFYVYRGTSIVCFMVYADHINLGFLKGARLKSERLEGTGKGMRHIKVRSPRDVDDEEFSRLIREAAEMVQKDVSSTGGHRAKIRTDTPARM